MSCDVELLVGTAFYSVCAIGGLALVKLLNYHWCFHSWLAIALLSRATWVLSASFHYGYLTQVEQINYHLSWKQCRIYFGMSLFLATIELLNATAMNILPGSLYALLKGSDVAWSMLLSHFVLHKSYNTLQVRGVCVVSLGILAVFLLDRRPNREETSSNNPIEQTDSLSLSVVEPKAAALLSILAALLNALCSVLTEKLLKAALQKEESRMDHATSSSAFKTDLELSSANDVLHSHAETTLYPQRVPSKLMHSNLYAMTTSFFSWVIMIVFGTATQSFRSIPSLRNHCTAAASANTINQNEPRKYLTITSFVICFLLIVGSRFGERISKHWICVHDSALTFQLINVGRRIFGVLVLAVLFQEPFSLGMQAGALLTSIGFGMHHAGAQRNSNQTNKQQSSTLNLNWIGSTQYTEIPQQSSNIMEVELARNSGPT